MNFKETVNSIKARAITFTKPPLFIDDNLALSDRCDLQGCDISEGDIISTPFNELICYKTDCKFVVFKPVAGYDHRTKLEKALKKPEIFKIEPFDTPLTTYIITNAENV